MGDRRIVVSACQQHLCMPLSQSSAISAAFRVERGAPFCAQTARFRSRTVSTVHPWARISVVRHGTGQMLLPGHARPVPVRPGSVVVARPRTQLEVSADGTMSMSRVFLSPEFVAEQVCRNHRGLAFDQASAQVLWRGRFPDPCQMVQLPAHQEAPVHDSLDALADATARQAVVSSHFFSQTWMMGVLAAVMPLLRLNGPEVSGQAMLPGLEPVGFLAPVIQQTIAWVEEHFRETWRLSDLAALASLSQSGLLKAFHLGVGKTPIGLRDELRVQELARLMCQTTLTVPEAAALVGWKAPDQAVARFRAAYGLMPSAWRKQAFLAHS